MGLLKKMKDILFDEELDYTEQIKITPEMRNEDIPAKEMSHEVIRHEKSVRSVSEEKPKPVSERDVFQSEPTFPILDFDESEFNFQNSYHQKVEEKPKPEPIRNTNVMDYERRKKIEKKSNYNGYTKMEITETIERKKFKPSPIISPVYGILDKDYSKEDIQNRKYDDKVSIEAVRDKAFGTKTPKLEATIEKPNVYETTETVTITRPLEKEKKGKTIDELLEDTSDIIVDINNDLDNEIESMIPDEEITKTIETKIVTKPVKQEKEETKKYEDTLENDLFDLIDQMYDDKEEGE